MICTNCHGTVFLTIDAKCYDMCTVSYGDKGITGNVPTNIGLGSNPNYVEFSYCLGCGKIHGDFPIQLPGEFRPPIEQPIMIEETISDMVQEFYNSVMSKQPVTITNRIISRISQNIQPTDASILTSAWQKFEELRVIHPTMPEFDETVDWVMSKYKGIKARAIFRAC